MKLRCFLLVLGVLVLPRLVDAQQQQTGLCDQIQMVINQQLAVERIGFQATLQITDNDPNNPITGFAANLTFNNPQMNSNGVPNDASSLFFVQPPTLQNITGISGNGVIGPGQTATVTWFIIPTVNAGGTNATGIYYNIGAALSGQINGTTIPASALLVIPAAINVVPDAQLQITYFQPRDVTGIDPYTGLGSPLPFTFGVLVQNVGYGSANNMSIDTQQPQIVANNNGLPLIGQLLDSRFDDSPLPNPNLTLNLGNLQRGQTAKGAWDMITTYSGTFLSVSAKYTHSSALGGQETSLIQSLNAYLFLHEVMDDLPGRDNLRDFLTDQSGTQDAIGNLIPDTLYESQGGVYPVNLLTNAAVSGSGLSCQISLSANIAGWSYLRLTDPNQAKLPILSVVRSDGKVLNTNNFWTNLHFEPVTNAKDTYLNLFDYVGLGSYTYSVTYTNVTSSGAPVTTLYFNGPEVYTNGIYYVTPQTQMFFVSQDALPVGILDSLNGSPFALARSFSVTAGTNTLQFYATNTVGQVETTHTATLVVQRASSLSFASVTGPSQPLVNPGSAASVRPATVPISFQPAPNATPLNARIDIFAGIAGWVTVSNVPSSPTAATAASLVVGGQNVDYYEYQLDGVAWSADFPVNTPITLTGLPTGSHTLSVLGRSQYGNYQAATTAATVSWVVDSSAPPTTVTGTPATPATGNTAQLDVGGTSVTDYQWTMDSGYYRAPASISVPLLLSNVPTGSHVVSVIGEVTGSYQPTNNATTVDWTVNPFYGYDLSSLPLVQSLAYSNLTGQTVTYNWNGTSSNGVAQPAGWYTARITLSDSVGDTNFAVVLIQVGGLSGASSTLAAATRDPQNPYARGSWAVWQDQSDGNWEIYAQKVTTNSAIQQLTRTSLSQQNPRTDGRYVVWQAQQTNGNWDIYMLDLQAGSGPQAVTSTPNIDETAPAIDWPWVVWQQRPTGSSAAWQVYALNLTSNAPPAAVSPSTQNELNPDVSAGRTVWQDLRNPGAGEIYYADLLAATQQRMTTNLFGKFNPAIRGNWIVWQDSRNIEVDLYGWNFLRQREVRITATPEDETQPFIDGPWVICMENSLGAGTGNGRVVYLPSLVTIPVTRTPTLKTSPSLANGKAVWLETVSNLPQVVSVALPSLQPVAQNNNVVAVTPAMAAFAQNAFGLLQDWGSNGVQSITAYTSLAPTVTTQTAYLTNGLAAGTDFGLVAGSFLWIQFSTPQVLDLGVNPGGGFNLSVGPNVVAYTDFPDSYRAYTLLQQLGLNNVTSVRMLDAASGRWRVAAVQAGTVVGDNFLIPGTAVLLINTVNAVNDFVPQSP
jgi:beta propeller repeat protein